MSHDYNPDWISPPGDTILDIIKESGGTVDALAEQLGFSDEEMNRLIRGVMPITRELALKLQNTIGAPLGFWMNREAQYRSELHRLATAKPELVLREAVVNRIKLNPGEVLVIKISGDYMDSISMADMDSLKKGFQSMFPNNRVALLAVPEGSSIDLTVGESSAYPEPVASCNASPVSYCGDCSCGKKERVEKQQKGE